MEESENLQNEAPKNEELLLKIEQLEEEKKGMQDEFNVQRAKLKDLFLQKEDELNQKTAECDNIKRELDDIKSQLVVKELAIESDFELEKRKAEEEISTLQQLIHETIEESSSSKSFCDSEFQKFQLYIQQLEAELHELKMNKQKTNESSSLAPSQVLNALTKGIAKKLGADSFSSQDSDDSLRRSDNETYEDPEVLKSLVAQLEDQITALKEKLRSMDEQMQKCKECSIQRPNNTEDVGDSEINGSNPTKICDKCLNLEQELAKERQNNTALTEKVLLAEKAAELHKEDLFKEILFRKELEKKWTEKQAEQQGKLGFLEQSTERAHKDLKELRRYFDQTRSEMLKSLEEVTQDREKIHHELNKLQSENDNLVGKYALHSQEFQREAINLPNTVEELHELILKHHQDLIIAKIGKEVAEVEVSNLQSDILMLRDQLAKEVSEKRNLEKNLVQEIEKLKVRNDATEAKIQELEDKEEKYSKMEMENKSKISAMTNEINELQDNKRQLTEKISEFKGRVLSMQQELDTSETVQKDFVLLSQSLQVQLERIRGSDTQVRWEHEEDAENCPNCHNNFSNSKRKQHCRHCGQIFCQQCLTKTVNSGPNMRPSKVCDVCHTLLVQSSAPYFSRAPPS